MIDPTPEQVLEMTKLAIDFGREALKIGRDPVVEMAKALDVHPMLRAANTEIENALDKKFGPRG